MGYGDYLKELLRPLALYELDEGYGGEEFNLVGERLDLLYERLLEIEREMLVPTAEGAGLDRFEELLPYRPSYETTEDRRRGIMALVRIDDCSFTPAELNNTLLGCGIRAHVEETDTAGTVLVNFPNYRGVPPGFEALRERIEGLLPCHLEVLFYFVYPSWAEIARWFGSWGEFEATGMSWEEFERYGG